jgi:hypothetical protein
MEGFFLGSVRALCPVALRLPGLQNPPNIVGRVSAAPPGVFPGTKKPAHVEPVFFPEALLIIY